MNLFSEAPCHSEEDCCREKRKHFIMSKPGLTVPELIQLYECKSQDESSKCASTCTCNDHENPMTESVLEMDRNVNTGVNSETGTLIISKKKTKSSCNECWLNNLKVDCHRMRKIIGIVLFLLIPLILIIGLPERVNKYSVKYTV